ncbi:protein of unknown function [Micropruina glycogenica]|uniref:Uncharacterized protein n=1 Tax=Micropruina glycogenica TaxID=75385 RepID=A0A2N9JDY4_9ACTN|nr:protein of unknown function [Micropruina glycogenica]
MKGMDGRWASLAGHDRATTLDPKAYPVQGLSNVVA